MPTLVKEKEKIFRINFYSGLGKRYFKHRKIGIFNAKKEKNSQNILLPNKFTFTP